MHAWQVMDRYWKEVIQVSTYKVQYLYDIFFSQISINSCTCFARRGITSYMYPKLDYIPKSWLNV